jgi:sec-independent protein translocase protein TatA
MPSLGPAEILVVLVVALLVFGPNKMPEIAKQVGKGFREFRRVQQHLKSELRDVVSEFDSPTSSPTVDQQAVPMLPPKDVTAEETAPPPEASAHVAPAAEEAPAPSSDGEQPPVPDPTLSLPTPEPDAASESA